MVGSHYGMTEGGMWVGDKLSDGKDQKTHLTKLGTKSNCMSSKSPILEHKQM